MKNKKIIVVMPTYNEVANIGKMIEVLFADIFPKIDANMHLLVVDDNSPDKTGDLVKKYMSKHKNLHLLTGNKEGLGVAYARGITHAVKELMADAVVEMDSDFQHDPKYLPHMVDAYLSGADYVIGSRYIKGGSIPQKWQWHRKMVSYLGNLYARLVLWLPNLHDATTGFRLTDTKIVKQIDLFSLMELKRFAFKVDLFYKSVKLAKKVVEVPISFGLRERETSKFSLKEMVATYKVVMLLRLAPFKRFLKFGMVGVIGFLVNAIGLELFRRLPVSIWLANYFDHFQQAPIARLLNTPSAWAAAFAAELAIISNFTFNNLWTFKDAKVQGLLKTLGKFLQFNLTSLGAIIIQFIVVGKATLLLGDTGFVRQVSLIVAVIFFIIPYNYTTYNLFIWKTWKLPWIKNKSIKRAEN